MVYLDKINRTIHAMKDAVQEQRRQKMDHEREQTQKTAVLKHEYQLVDDDEFETECKTFGEFGLESRILEASKVEWAFSAMY